MPPAAHVDLNDFQFVYYQLVQSEALLKHFVVYCNANTDNVRNTHDNENARTVPVVQLLFLAL